MSALAGLGRLKYRSERACDARNRTGLLVFLCLLIIYLGRYPNFLSVSNLFVTLQSITSIGVVALGETALLVSGNVDLSVGSNYAFTGVCAALVADESGNWAVGVITGLVVGTVVGYFNGRLVRHLKINPLIVTLGTATLLQGLAYAVTAGIPVSNLPSEMVTLGQKHFGQVPLQVIIGAVVYVVGGVVLVRTVLGLRTYAIGGNRDAVRLSGIDPDRYVTGLYAVTGFLTGLVAVMDVSRLNDADPSVGVGFNLVVLTAVILGGVAFNGGSGHPFGAFIGVLTIGVLNAGVVFANYASYWQYVVQGTALIVALAADQFTVYRRGRRRAAVDRVSLVEAGRPDAQSPSGLAGSDGAWSRLPDVVDGEVVLSANGLTKQYGPVVAVKDATFSARAGEILCLAGDNGAGKSTLIKMLSGALRPDGGSISVRGTRVNLDGPSVARSLGVYTAYQELALCPNLGAAENLTLGAEPTRTNWGVLSWRDDRAAVRQARERLAALNIVLDDYRRPVGLLSGGQRQAVAIARVVQHGASVVILDEPTAALGVRQTESVLSLIRRLAAAGVAVIMITHDVETIVKNADRIVILRLGSVRYDGPASDITQSDLVHLMAGFPMIRRDQEEAVWRE
jgi:ribose/xylose/arabinose/galactoside ABC-type transport system permease subunit/ABC-type multidrug transport system ATPase subunit